MYGLNNECKLKLLCTENSNINNECKLKIIMYRNRNIGNLVIFFYITGSSKSILVERRVTVSYSST